MTTLELLAIPGIADTTNLKNLLKQSRKRMVKCYNSEAMAVALANAKAKAKSKEISAR